MLSTAVYSALAVFLGAVALGNGDPKDDRVRAIIPTKRQNSRHPLIIVIQTLRRIFHQSFRIVVAHLRRLVSRVMIPGRALRIQALHHLFCVLSMQCGRIGRIVMTKGSLWGPGNLSPSQDMLQ